MLQRTHPQQSSQEDLVKTSHSWAAPQAAESGSFSGALEAAFLKNSRRIISYLLPN